jgi:hypothetical protein
MTVCSKLNYRIGELVRYLALAVLACQVPVAQAITPPPSPPEYSAYGPWQVCSQYYTVDVAADEAVHVVGNVVRILHDDHLLALVPVTLANDQLGRTMRVAGPEAEIVPYFRVIGPTLARSKDIRYASNALADDDVRYAARISNGAEDMFIVIGSTRFKGNRSDIDILKRVLRPEAKAFQCLEAEAVQQYRITSDPNGPLSHAFVRKNFDAKIYPRVPLRGPRFHCQSGLGFNIEEGELLFRPWKSLGWDGPTLIARNGVYVKVSGTQEALRPLYPTESREHPLGLMHKSEIFYYASRGVGPPHAADNVRENGSWEIILGRRSATPRVHISFHASELLWAGVSHRA